VSRVVRLRGAASKAGRELSDRLARAQRLGRAGRAILAGWVLGVVGVSIVSLPPLVAVTLGRAVDTSWKIGQVIAARDHLQWGTQVIWPFGPLGYIDSPPW
jgi:hypothetical protein